MDRWSGYGEQVLTVISLNLKRCGHMLHIFVTVQRNIYFGFAISVVVAATACLTEHQVLGCISQ
ncbi:hypothetical protein, partial [Staphylococcus shinii]|uniref:hypothetical protein n=1 Tax=Staphylococcus shinii TaxID=2912228 RepID=UPI003CF4C5A2